MEGVTAFNYLLMMGLSAGVMPSVLGVPLVHAEV